MGTDPESHPRDANAPRVGAVIVAAGQSTRMGGVDKTFALVHGLPLLAYTLDQFEQFAPVTDVVPVLAPRMLGQGRLLARSRNYTKISRLSSGGERRQDSVRAGLKALGECDWVIVHDGARPCLNQDILQRGLEAAYRCGAAVAGVPVKDTIKVVSEQREVRNTPPRETLWAAQTPQIFRYDLLVAIHELCTDDFTDDAAMVESLGHPVDMFLGSYENLKVTTPEDLTVVATLLSARSA
ncbi:MAG: 2-C-methyl-D-erythritol 4-phosphate cytidylyltransferase [Dehalococcoidia bacterium]